MAGGNAKPRSCTKLEFPAVYIGNGGLIKTWLMAVEAPCFEVPWSAGARTHGDEYDEYGTLGSRAVIPGAGR